MRLSSATPESLLIRSRESLSDFRPICQVPSWTIVTLLLSPLVHTCSIYNRLAESLRTDAKVAVLYGGISERSNIDTLKSEQPNMVVGTPGRVKSLVEKKHLDVKSVRHFVVDECDKVLDQLDMRRDVQIIFKNTPHDKQVKFI